MKAYLALFAATGLAGAAPPAVPPPPADPAIPSAQVHDVVVTARRPTHVSGVTVTATSWCPDPDPVRHPADRAPQVADSYPRPGEVIAPGYALVRVSFDAPMSCYSEVTVDGGDGDPCQPSGVWTLPARRSWTMQCRLDPSTSYKISFRRSEGRGFVGLSGRTAGPYELSFATSAGPPTPSLVAAQAADPGSSGETPAAAYVTCSDSGARIARDCQHQVVRPPGR